MIKGEMMRKILITNDDGIEADGIIRLASAAKEFGQVWVVAPDSQRSAMSHSITLRHSFDAWEVEFPVEGVHAFACTGTPADCVRIGVRNIVPGGPDVAFSGINLGYNASTDIQYSATAGAAFEAQFQGLHSIAFSEGFEKNHSVTDKYLSQIIEELIDSPLGEKEIWNVNFPTCELKECKGILRDRVVSGDRYYDDEYVETPNTDGTISYMVKGFLQKNFTKGSDLEAVFNNYISIGKARNIT